MAKKIKTDTTDQPVFPFDETTAIELAQMLEWWKAHKDGLETLMESPQSAETRPTFKRDRTVTKTVRLAAQLVERAEKEARRQKNISGGSLSGLVEVLLWRFLGCPNDLILHED